VPEPLPPLSDLPADEKARRAASFGGVASEYQRYRPGPAAAAVDWLLPAGAARVVDLGAGTGALTRLLVGRVAEVVAVEPDDRMRAVLAEQLPDAQALRGFGEAIPLPDSSVDAVLASSSWHWMDPVPTLEEVARVLRPGGTLGAVWSGPDEDSPFISQARTLLSEHRSPDSDLIMGDVDRPRPMLEIPAGLPFSAPEHEVFRWEMSLTADDLIGLLGTLSWFILMNDEQRQRVFAEARRLLRELLDVEGDATIDVGFKADAWRSRFEG
jgi:SAM-dependent methyltransferase